MMTETTADTHKAIQTLRKTETERELTEREERRLVALLKCVDEDSRQERTHPIDRSSWIETVLYKSTPAGRFLAIFLRTEPGQTPAALLYAGPPSALPSWLPGLLLAGIVKGRDETTGELRRSVGRAYNVLLKGREDRGGRGGLRYQRVEGRERVSELRRMMEAGR